MRTPILNKEFHAAFARKVTPGQMEVLLAIYGSCYHDGREDEPHDMVWTFSVIDECSIKGKAFSGTVSTLIQAELIGSDDYGFSPGHKSSKDACMWLTQAGLDVIWAAQLGGK